jgi:tyrosinase
MPVATIGQILSEGKMANIRKNVKNLSSTEKQNLIKAIKGLKANGRYNWYVTTHAAAAAYATPSNVSPSYRNAAHQGPAFLPWHRYFIWLFEQDLQKVVSGVTLPYWDWGADSTLSNPASAPVWGTDLMGGNGDPNRNWLVTTGPFAYNSSDPNTWYIVDANGNNIGGLKRQFGQQASGLPPQGDISGTINSTNPYDVSPWDGTSGEGPDFRNQAEGWYQCCHLHNQVHLWVGQSMLPMTSPNDPVFFLHHCNVDRIWAQWQAQHPSLGYVPVSGGPPGHNLNDAMYPWNTGTNNITPNTVLKVSDGGYSYQ